MPRGPPLTDRPCHLGPCVRALCAARSYIKAALGSPTPADYESVVAEKEGLQKQLEEANAQIAELQARVRGRVALGEHQHLACRQHACRVRSLPWGTPAGL